MAAPFKAHLYDYLRQILSHLASFEGSTLWRFVQQSMQSGELGLQ